LIEIAIDGSFLLKLKLSFSSSELKSLSYICICEWFPTFCLNMKSWDWWMMTNLFSKVSKIFHKKFISFSKNRIKWFFTPGLIISIINCLIDSSMCDSSAPSFYSFFLIPDVSERLWSYIMNQINSYCLFTRSLKCSWWFTDSNRQWYST